MANLISVYRPESNPRAYYALTNQLRVMKGLLEANMITPSELIPISGFVGLAVGEAHFYVLRRRERILRNATRMKIAEANLESHIKAFERFCDDVGSPHRLREVLLHFSDAISHAETAFLCAEGLTVRPSYEITDETKEILAELTALRIHRSDLAAAFDTAVMSGLMYMLLRWPETSRVFEEATSRIAADPTRGVGFATRAAHITWPRPFTGYGPEAIAHAS